MSSGGALHRAWVLFGVGCGILSLALLQLWAGKAFIGFKKLWHPNPWVQRRKEPYLFWFLVGLMAAAGAFAIGLGLMRIV